MGNPQGRRRLNKHHTKLKGDVGLSAIIKDLTIKGYFVSIPVSENAPFDLIASDDHTNYRVQVKARSVYRGAVEIQFRTSWADRHGTHYTRYAVADFDVLAIYVLDDDRCMYFKPKGELSVTIRLEEPLNNQSSGVRTWREFQSFPPSETIRDTPKGHGPR